MLKYELPPFHTSGESISDMLLDVVTVLQRGGGKPDIGLTIWIPATLISLSMKQLSYHQM